MDHEVGHESLAAAYSAGSAWGKAIAERELARIRDENARLTADLSKLRDDLETLIQQRDEAQRRRGEIEAECEALRADVVWAVRGYIRPIDDGQRLAIGIDPQTLFTRMVEWDGTDADILSAVREARE